MILMAAFLFVGIVACGGKTTTTTPTTQPSTTGTPTTVTTGENTLPVISGADDVTVYVGDAFNPLTGVTATDAEDGSLTASIELTGTVDLNTAGDYTLTYTVTDSRGGEAEVTRVVTVILLELVYPTGMYNYKFATTELRHTFMAAAEKYLMNNMYGGIPLFANGGFVLYSSRLQLPVEDYVAVMGYGTGFATMTADDSTVLMDNGQPGNVGEYTYRTTISTNPGTWNQWLYDTSTDSDLMGVYMDALYTYHFNDDKTGYAVVPSMAASDPTPVDSYITETGKEVSKVWRITLRDDLEWYYHPDTVITGLPVGHEVIDANDFVETFKLALDKEWFRAISGGGDFISSTNKIKNAQEYLDGSATWEEVGIKLINDLTFEFEFVDDQSDWNVRYFLSSFVMTPINIDLFEALGGEVDTDVDGSYGTDNKTIAYHGPYFVNYFEADKILRYKENPNYHNPNEYFYTGYTFSVIEDSAVRFQEFVAGKLESTSLPTENYDEYKDYPGIRQVPGATTFRMMINGLGTVQNQRDQFPDGTWVPEPILANQDFKMAMFFAIDRQKLAEEVLKTSTTQMYLFSDAYLVDPEMGVPYRQTDQGLTVGEGLSPSTYGYNVDAARAYWELAIDALVADGTYTAGTQAAFNVIQLDFNIFSGSVAQSLMGDYIKTTFESLFISYDHYIKVQINVQPKDFPGIYYDYMMVGEFDLSIGGISGSTLDAASFLDVFSSDNRGGFTLNWGIDTSPAEIEIRYTDFEGVRHWEMWSFDAITAALNGQVYLQNGEEAIVPAAVVTDYTPTSVFVEIREFNNAAFTNLTYTVEYYSYDDDAYYPLDGFIDIPITAATFEITGLDNYYYWYDASGSIAYQGDYQVVVTYALTEDTSLGASTTTPWFTTDTILPGSATNGRYPAANLTLTPTSAVVNLVLNADYSEAITAMDVYSITDSFAAVTTATVDFTNLAAVSIGNLEIDTYYLVVITFADGNWDAIRFSTPGPIASAVVTPAETSATINLTVNESDSVTRTITAAVVYLNADDTVVAGATVDYTNYTAISVTGLTAETAYYIEFTFSDGSVGYVDVVTPAPTA
jgi:ABC-type oligopeptide transport system substrate-binding subunit